MTGNFDLGINLGIWVAMGSGNQPESSKRNPNPNKEVSMSQEQHNVHEEAKQQAEPWEEWESKLVKYSLIIGVAALVVFGALVNLFVLP